MTEEERNEDLTTRNFFFRWLIIIGIVNLVILGIMAMGLVANFGNTTDDINDVQFKQDLFAQKLRNSNIISCERGAILLAYEIIEAGRRPTTGNAATEQASTYELFPLRDCQKSEATGRRYDLPEKDKLAFITNVASKLGIPDWDKRTAIRSGG